MFDIGFTELVLIAIVSLLVIGPDRLPGAIRTGSLWLGRLKRGFNDIKREVEQELHNDNVMQELKKAGTEVKEGAAKLQTDIERAGAEISSPAHNSESAAKAPRSSANKNETPGE